MEKKVLVVDDSAFMRKIISDIVQKAPGFRVVATAKNGEEAVKLIPEIKPDVVTMDIEMPILSGLEALERIMKIHPVPIIMVSSLTQEGAKETIKALELGAVDFIGKPSGSISLDMHKTEQELHEKLRTASQIQINRVVASPKPRYTAPPIEIRATNVHVGAKISQIVAIGTSTGGPKALNAVLTSLPAGIHCPIVIVQHMPPKFTKSLAQRLDQSCRVSVKEAEHGEELKNGVVYIAPGGQHMECVLSGGTYKIHLSDAPPRGSHKPSVEILLESLNKLGSLKRHYIILTGMGHDGSKALTEGKKLGVNTTIVESSETCIVYGMPRAAVELGHVDQIVPLYGITNKIIEITERFK